MRTVRDLPTPPGSLPFLGHALQVDVPRLHHQLEGWATTYGGLYRAQLGRQQMVVVSEPEHVSQVLKGRPRTFRRQHHLAQIIEELGVKGVFTAEGERWTAHRKLAMRALGQHRLEGFFPLLHRVGNELLERWDRTAGQALPLQDDCVAFTVDVTTELAFADKAGSVRGDRSSLLQSLDPIFPALARRLFALVPYWRWFSLPRDRSLNVALEEVRAYMEQTIARARTQHDGDDFLHAMLEESDGAGTFDEEALFGNAMTMLLAGEDTTANTLAWAVHLLLEHPNVFADLRAEADRAFTGRLASTLAETQLPLTERVIHEVMRLKPVAPILFHEAIIDTSLGDVSIPAGSLLLVLTRKGALEPSRFPNPERFDPERWRDPRRIALEQREGHFVPFGSGPRLCPGRALALIELRLVLSLLAKNYDLERVGDAESVREVNGFTMSPVGLNVRLRRRD